MYIVFFIQSEDLRIMKATILLCIIFTELSCFFLYWGANWRKEVASWNSENVPRLCFLASWLVLLREGTGRKHSICDSQMCRNAITGKVWTPWSSGSPGPSGNSGSLYKQCNSWAKEMLQVKARTASWFRAIPKFPFSYPFITLVNMSLY